MGKVTTRKLKSLIREEKMAAKMYRRLGYPNIAKQEAGHARKLTKELNRRKMK